MGRRPAAKADNNGAVQECACHSRPSTDSLVNADKPHYVNLEVALYCAAGPTTLAYRARSKKAHHRPLYLDDLLSGQPSDSGVDVRPFDGYELVDHHVTIVIKPG